MRTRRNLVGTMLLAEETVKREIKKEKVKSLVKLMLQCVMQIFKTPSATSNTQFSKIGCSFTTQC